MIIRKSLRKKIIISTISVCTSVFIIGAAVGGYYSSCDSNPYKSFYRTIATDTTQSYLSAYLSAKLSGVELILLSGFSFATSLNVALNQARFNDVGFLLIDDTYRGPSTTQVSSLNFRVDEGSFITGIAIGMYLNEYKDYFTHDDGKLTWGCYGGMNFPSVSSFMGGFQQGIKFFNDIIVPNNNKLMKIEQVLLGANINDNYAGGFGPSDGNSLIDKFLLKPIDCFIPVAGTQAASAASKIFQKQNKRTIIIGVDSALEQDKTFSKYKLPQVPGVKCPENIVTFSSLKKIDLAIPQIINKINKGEAPSNNMGGLGFNSVGNLTNNSVGVSQAGEPYFIKAMQILDSSISDLNSATQNTQLKTWLNRLGESQYSVYYAQHNPTYVQKPVGNDSTGVFTYSIQLTGESMAAFNSTKPSDVDMTQTEWESKGNFNLKNFIQPGKQSDENKIELILSSSNSVLLDSSFSQSSYLGMYYFYKENNINIPPIKG